MLSKALSLCIKTYQLCISPLLGTRCRFFPSCSDYALSCLQHETLPRALLKSTWRILRCQPFSKGGVDLP